MAQITTLKDNEGKTLYPITSGKAVFDENGVDMETRINGMVEKVQGKVLSSNDFTDADKQKLNSLPTNAQLTTTLNGKQGALEDSEDVTVNGNKLTVTERAKRQLLIDWWENLGYSTVYFDRNTGLFCCDDVKDLTYEEALYLQSIYDGGRGGYLSFRYGFTLARTLLPIRGRIDIGATSISQICYNGWNLVCIRFDNAIAVDGDMKYAFTGCQKLEKIYGTINLLFTSSVIHANAFNNCTSLKTISLKALKTNVSFAWSPLLSYSSLSYMITNAVNTSAITITVHPTVYAKLIGDTTNSAYNDLTDEEKEQWTALVVTAAEKNITFATI